MHQNRILVVFIFVALLSLTSVSNAQQVCFTAAERAKAEQTAKVWRAPDPDYDPVLGYSPTKGPRRGAPLVDANGFAKPLNCVANKDEKPGAGT
ncbi:MAG TPA: hypothetical protein VF075_12320, partial [Pyrinomonadaceae bacterium]